MALENPLEAGMAYRIAEDLGMLFKILLRPSQTPRRASGQWGHLAVEGERLDLNVVVEPSRTSRPSLIIQSLAPVKALNPAVRRLAVASGTMADDRDRNTLAFQRADDKPGAKSARRSNVNGRSEVRNRNAQFKNQALDGRPEFFFRSESNCGNDCLIPGSPSFSR